MAHLSDDVRGAVNGFVIRVCKGLLDDPRWDWDIERFNWQEYLQGFNDPTILRTTIAVFLNNLEIDQTGSAVNYIDARFRAFQYFRMMIDPAYAEVQPPFAPAELEEPDLW
jgi:hypothetical protein